MQRMEGLSKLAGRERYVDDIPAPGCLWGVHDLELIAARVDNAIPPSRHAPGQSEHQATNRVDVLFVLFVEQ